MENRALSGGSKDDLTDEGIETGKKEDRKL
jgi:hypothetical protein